MKKIGILLIAVWLICNVQVGAQVYDMEFGVPIVDTLVFPSSEFHITSITRDRLKSKYKKKKYYGEEESKWEDSINIEYYAISDTLYVMKIPPLEPNEFYRIRIKYVNSYNIFGLFSKIHRQPKEEFNENKGWKRTLNILNVSIPRFSIFYDPQDYELENFKLKISAGVDFTEYDRLGSVLRGLDENEPRFHVKRDSITSLISKERKVVDKKLKRIIINAFPNLKYRENVIDSENIYDYSRWIIDPANSDDLRGKDFVTIFNYCPDYISVLEFYYKRILPYLGQNPFSDYEGFIEFVIDQAAREREYLTEIYGEEYPLPNILLEENLDELVEFTSQAELSSYPLNYNTSFNRSVLPDFGFNGYIPYENGLSGGATYLGGQISFVPSNKNVPLSLTRYTFEQRLSVHAGISFNPLAEEGRRKDLFKSTSLMLGMGYKVFTQSTRLNLGLVAFQKLDPITQSASLGIHPYIGLSIDADVWKLFKAKRDSSPVAGDLKKLVGL